jgi:3-isopropylmalate dehydrogenase
MGHHRIAVMEGDGIGPEIVKETLKVLRAVESMTDGLTLELVLLPVGLSAYEQEGSTFPAQTLEGLAGCNAALLGPVSTHIYEKGNQKMINPSAFMRKEFDLYANIRPAKKYAGVQSRFDDVDLVIVRENTQGMYSDRNLYFGSGEMMPDPDTVLSLRVITRSASERLAKVGFELASVRRRSVSIIHKMNVLRNGCGLFVDSCLKVGSKFENMSVKDYHVDAFAMYLVQRPEDFDVIVTTNMFGDILSDLTAGLIGGMGLAPGLNLGEHFMLAQATHGSAPDIAGHNVANPLAEILSAKMMLEWLGIRNQDESALSAASLIQAAVEQTLQGNIKTPDLGGASTTQQVGDRVVSELNLACATR